MTAGRFVSQVFDVGAQLHDRLSAVAWPAHPTLGPGKISVEFGDEKPGQSAERVVVRLNGDESDIDGYKRFSPPGSDETVIFEVYVISRVPNVTSTPGGPSGSRKVWDRLAELAAPAQRVLFDTTTEQVRLLEFDGEVQVAHTDRVNPTVWFEDGTGWVGECVITMRFLAAI